jgi:hypothetical protein
MTLQLLTSILLAITAARGDDKGPIYELRTYTTAPGKLDVLVNRFRETNIPLFKKHGINLVGAWTPYEADDQGDRLVYLVSFPDRDAAKAAWTAFLDDPGWKSVFDKEKQAHGNVVAKGESVFLKLTDFSPVPNPGAEGRVFELRTYTASPNRLEKLLARFRDHTVALFKGHGMTSVFYGVPMDADKGADNTLTYMLAFPDRDASRASWKAFQDDPEWQKVKADSQADGVPLAAKVVSHFLKPTDFSPLK